MNKLASVSTDGLAAHERNRSWLTFLTTHLGRESENGPHLDIAFTPASNQEFKGLLEFGDVGTLGLNRILSSASRFVRTPEKHLRSDSPAMVIVQLRGTAYIRQEERSICLLPGYWNIFDTSIPFSVEYAEQNEHLILMQNMDGDWRHELKKIGQHSLGEDGLTRTVRDLMIGTYRECTKMHASAAQASADTIGQLLRVALTEAASQPPTPSAQRQKIQIINYINAHLSVENLGICHLAEALGYSVRQIHRIFQEQAGMTVSQYIWNCRLNRSFEELKDATNDHRSITEIAFAWGFNSSAHFSRAFKELYGISPRQCRIRTNPATCNTCAIRTDACLHCN
jgi:AraC-like DNA-binding protein